MMAKIVLVALFAVVAVQLIHGSPVPAPKPDETVSVKSEAATEAVKAATVGDPLPASSGAAGLREVEVKVGVDAVEAKPTVAAEPAKEVAKEVAKA